MSDKSLNDGVMMIVQIYEYQTVVTLGVIGVTAVFSMFEYNMVLCKKNLANDG